MKIEFLASGAEECPLIRLFEFQMSEVKQLREVCLALAEDEITEFALHDQRWVNSISNCQFVWRMGSKDTGVMRPNEDEPFVLELSQEAWREVADKLLPFVEGRVGFNWLTNEGDVEVLSSYDGKW